MGRFEQVHILNNKIYYFNNFNDVLENVLLNCKEAVEYYLNRFKEEKNKTLAGRFKFQNIKDGLTFNKYKIF